MQPLVTRHRLCDYKMRYIIIEYDAPTANRMDNPVYCMLCARETYDLIFHYGFT